MKNMLTFVLRSEGKSYIFNADTWKTAIKAANEIMGSVDRGYLICCNTGKGKSVGYN